ncbi:hypothetical protein BJY59DRAFT_704948 [Rhodotorula toruloides]
MPTPSNLCSMAHLAIQSTTVRLAGCQRQAPFCSPIPLCVRSVSRQATGAGSLPVRCPRRRRRTRRQHQDQGTPHRQEGRARAVQAQAQPGRLARGGARSRGQAEGDAAEARRARATHLEQDAARAWVPAGVAVLRCWVLGVECAAISAAGD